MKITHMFYSYCLLYFNEENIGKEPLKTDGFRNKIPNVYLKITRYIKYVNLNTDKKRGGRFMRYLNKVLL